MKVLIENYSNLYSTEPIYFQNVFKMAECDAYLWNTSINSAYDAIDMIKPDILLIKWNCSKIQDIIRYITTNENAPDLIINVTYCPKETVNYLKSLNKAKVFFTNEYTEHDYDIKKTHLIMPGADIFIPPIHIPEYSIDAAICYESLEQDEFPYESYHKLHFGVSNDKNCDLNVTLINLTSLYSKYKEFVLIGDINFLFSQIFFDANLKSEKVTIKNKPEDNDNVRYILSQIFSLNNSENIQDQIKSQIKTKHTCINRTQQLLKILGNDSAANKLNNI